MVAPLVAAAGISAASSILGGMFQRKSDKRAQARLDARDDSKYQRATVDAKKAGLHPLFALGSGGVSAPPQAVGGSTYQRAGDAVGRAASTAYSQYAATKSPTLSEYDRNMQALNLANMTRQNQLLDLELISKSAGVPGAAPSGMPLPTGTMDDMKSLEGLIQPEASIVRTTQKDQPHKSAGENPAFMQVNFGPDLGGSWNVPWSEEGPKEALEGPTGWTLFYLANRKRINTYGKAKAKSIFFQIKKAHAFPKLKQQYVSKRAKIQNTFFAKTPRQTRGY